jgi:hypothetical protein
MPSRIGRRTFAATRGIVGSSGPPPALAVEPRDEGEHDGGAVFGADPVGELDGAVAVGRTVEAGPQRVAQGVGGQLVQG